MNNVDLAVRGGTIHGLIGPNGSGQEHDDERADRHLHADRGDHLVRGPQIGGSAPSQIALSGIARTFQNVQLFGEMTALENVLVGLHHTFRSNLLDVGLKLPRAAREENAARERAFGLLKFVGLAYAANEEARKPAVRQAAACSRSHGPLALDPKLLLLDEPARRPHGTGHQGAGRDHPQDPRLSASR